MTPQQILIRAVLNLARAFVGVHEVPMNGGQMVAWFQKITGNEPPAAWCLSFALRCVFSVCGDAVRVSRDGGRCSSFADWAQHHELVATSAAVGDILLVYHVKEGRVAHACLIDRVLDNGRVETIGGNESDPSIDPQDPKSREGLMVSHRTGKNARTVGKDDVLDPSINAVDFAALSRVAA